MRRYNIDVLNAFDHFGTLFDAVEGHKDAFKTSMEGIEQDAYGPQVNIRNELDRPHGPARHADHRLLDADLGQQRTVADRDRGQGREQAGRHARQIMEKEPDVERREFGDFRDLGARAGQMSAIAGARDRRARPEPARRSTNEEPPADEEQQGTRAAQFRRLRGATDN